MKTLEQIIAALLAPYPDSVQFKVRAHGLLHDGDSWSSNDRFTIAEGDKEEVLRAARGRWEVFKANYAPRARVSDITDIGDESGGPMLEVDFLPFLDIEPETPHLPPGPLEHIAARYESQGSCVTAAKIREAAAYDGEVLVYRALRSFSGGFTTEAIPLCGEDARTAWDEILRSDWNAYDRPRIYRGMLGPFAL